MSGFRSRKLRLAMSDVARMSKRSIKSKHRQRLERAPKRPGVDPETRRWPDVVIIETRVRIQVKDIMQHEIRECARRGIGGRMW